MADGQSSSKNITPRDMNTLTSSNYQHQGIVYMGGDLYNSVIVKPSNTSKLAPTVVETGALAGSRMQDRPGRG